MYTTFEERPFSVVKISDLNGDVWAKETRLLRQEIAKQAKRIDEGWTAGRFTRQV